MNNDNSKSFPIEFSGKNAFMSDVTDSLEDTIKRFPDIGSENNTVIITDPYLFKPKDDNYKNNVILALNNLKASKIIYCNKNQPNNAFFTEVANSLQQCTLEYKSMDRLHDRQWFCIETKKGFFTGTSLNGIDTKICAVDPISEETCNDLYRILMREGIVPNGRNETT